LLKRVSEHKSNAVKGFTRQHNIHTLVWHETHETMESAIIREKKLKKWKRAYKIELIENVNPAWADLFREITG
jgi:putative endonuclease